MEQLVARVKQRFSLDPNCSLNKLLVLDITKRGVVHSEGIPNPAQHAGEVWNMWQTATGLIEPTDQSADQVIQIRSGAQQTILFNDSQFLLFVSLGDSN